MSAQTPGADLCLKPLYHNERHLNAPHYHTVFGVCRANDRMYHEVETGSTKSELHNEQPKKEAR